MIKKMFKTIFILSLCIGITLPANAGAVQVSDGSAFVTKAELSYELNNLSSRMSQLEASLDSRIDELVSSYLTRNGVWNGVDVDVDKTESKLTSSDFISSWTSWEEKEKTVWSKSATANKSGMIFCTVHIEGKQGTQSSTQYRCYLRMFGGVWTGFEDDARLFLLLTENVNNTVFTRSRIEIANSQQRTTYNNSDGLEHSSESTHILPLPLNNDYVLIGFVSKGNNVKISMTHYISDFQNGDTGHQMGMIGGSYLSTTVTDCKIY